MKERPILFSGPMALAILDGRKTQTRRIVKLPIPEKWGGATDRVALAVHCPYGAPGDQLWVRESFSVQPSAGCTFGESMMGKKLTVSYKAGGPETHLRGGEVNGPGFHADYAAADYDPCKYGLGRPSIHMPRWASRLTLEITSARVERLNEISADDALSEGVDAHILSENCEKFMRGKRHLHPAVRKFGDLWESINGAGSWAANPWVWCVSFRKLEGGQP